MSQPGGAGSRFDCCIFVAQRGRSSANERERRRMKQLNRAYDDLKNTLPWIPIDSKLTKLEILVYAVNYMDYLMKELAELSEPINVDEVSNNALLVILLVVHVSLLTSYLTQPLSLRLQYDITTIKLY